MAQCLGKGAFATVVLFVAIAPAHADALSDKQRRIEELTKNSAISSQGFEVFIGGATLQELLSILGQKPFAASMVSRNIKDGEGQIIPGKSAFLEFHSDPSVEIKWQVSNLEGRWIDNPPRLDIALQAEMKGKIGLKAKVGIIDHISLAVDKTEHVQLSLMPELVENAWLKAAVLLNSPRSSIEIDSEHLGKTTIALPVSYAFGLSDPMIINSVFSNDRKIDITVTPSSSKSTSKGMSLIGNLSFESKQ